MSLRWDLSKIQDYENYCFRVDEQGNRVLTPETEAIIFYTMFTGVGWGINEENVDEFVWRAKFMDRLHGPVYNLGDDAGPSEELLRGHLGIWTNVAYEPRAEWLDRQFRTFHNLPWDGGKEPGVRQEDEDDELV